MNNRLLSLIASLLLVCNCVSAQQVLRACGSFQNWDPLKCEDFNYENGLYTLDIDFSKGASFKITTSDFDGVKPEDAWGIFDAGALSAVVLSAGQPCPLYKGIENINSPIKELARVTVDLENMTIMIGDEADVRQTWSGTLPVMFVNTENGQDIVSKEDYIAGNYWIDPCGTGFEAIGSSEAPLPLQIRGRGNYTWRDFDKKPYRIKLDSKAPLLGMSKSKHFVLLAHADDKTGFMRNCLGFELSRRLNLAWTPSDKPVELVLNGQYRGLYFLTENIRVDEKRVNIFEQPDNFTEDVTGGWLVEIDNYDSDPHITLHSGDGGDTFFTYKTPEELSLEQEQFLKDEMQRIDDLIYSQDKSSARWGDYVDFEELARFYIVNEICDDYESFHGSCYLYREKGEGEKWKFGPVWDFGNSFTEDKYRYCYDNRTWRQVWIGEMCKFPEFMSVVKKVWFEFLESPQSNLDNYFNELRSAISVAARYDRNCWPNYGASDFEGASQEAYNRMKRSIEWLKEQWGVPAGIDGVNAVEKDVMVYVSNHELVIEASVDGVVVVSDLSGRVQTLTVQSGRNNYSLPRGFYIVAGKKIVL